MNVDGKHFHTIWLKRNDPKVVQIIDQRSLPHQFVIEDITSSEEMVAAISEMHVRGAPLIGVAAAFGVYLATLEAKFQANPDNFILAACHSLCKSRPTAINLRWAVERLLVAIGNISDHEQRAAKALAEAQNILAEEVERCKNIGEQGLKLLNKIYKDKPSTINILTHCNAGWLACIDYGTATAPIYLAAERGLPLHVWVDETRPRNQGARLTAWELGQHGISHTVITDNAAGHVMQNGMVDIVIVGTDRTAANGDVANKIGTYQKALAAHDNKIPFYVAAPFSSIDWSCKDGSEIPIENRNEREVTHIRGEHAGKIVEVRLTPKDSPATNFAFDVTPARLVTGLITERGICSADSTSLKKLYPDATSSKRILPEAS